MLIIDIWQQSRIEKVMQIRANMKAYIVYIKPATVYLYTSAMLHICMYTEEIFKSASLLQQKAEKKQASVGPFFPLFYILVPSK